MQEEHIGYYKSLNKYENYKDLMTENEFKDILRHKRSRYGKRYRANKKLTNMTDYMASSGVLDANILAFATLTLSDKALYKLDGTPKKIETINKIQDRRCKEIFKYAMLNEDYGDKNDRLHHHAIGILNDNIELIPIEERSKKGYKQYKIKGMNENYGWIIIEIFNIEDNKKLTNYLLKINNHSNKATTKRKRIRVLGDKDLINEMQVFKKIKMITKNIEFENQIFKKNASYD